MQDLHAAAKMLVLQGIKKLASDAAVSGLKKKNPKSKLVDIEEVGLKAPTADEGDDEDEGKGLDPKDEAAEALESAAEDEESPRFEALEDEGDSEGDDSEMSDEDKLKAMAKKLKK